MHTIVSVNDWKDILVDYLQLLCFAPSMGGSQINSTQGKIFLQSIPFLLKQRLLFYTLSIELMDCCWKQICSLNLYVKYLFFPHQIRWLEQYPHLTLCGQTTSLMFSPQAYISFLYFHLNPVLALGTLAITCHTWKGKHLSSWDPMD